MTRKNEERRAAGHRRNCPHETYWIHWVAYEKLQFLGVAQFLDLRLAGDLLLKLLRKPVAVVHNPRDTQTSSPNRPKWTASDTQREKRRSQKTPLTGSRTNKHNLLVNGVLN